MDKDWLLKMFEEAGLDRDQAEMAAKEGQLRLLTREQPEQPSSLKRRIPENLVRDPLVSFSRIIGRGDAGLPFVDTETGSLSTATFSHVLSEVGVDPVVSVAYSKVIVEMYEPKDLYQEVWEGLGRQGPVNLDDLRRMDWSPLRSEFPDLELPAHLRPTEQVRVKPKARPPIKKKPVTGRVKPRKKAPPKKA